MTALVESSITLAVPTDAPTVFGPPQGAWSYAFWERLDHEQARYEVIDGVLYVTTAPSFFHQWIVQNFVRYLGAPAMDQGLAFGVPSPVGVIMPGCDPVQPDYVIVLAARASIIRDRRIRGVPDLLVEVLSPGNSPYDEEVKRDAYARAGLQEYVIVDPRTRTLRHYRLERPNAYGEPRVLGEADEARFACLPTISVPVGKLFAGSPDTSL